MPTIDLTDAEHAALVALIRRAIEEDLFPRAPRLDSLRTALVGTGPDPPRVFTRPAPFRDIGRGYRDEDQRIKYPTA
jgi:hypothetical protein